MAMFFAPNGMWMPNWTPTKVGADFELPATLEPLKALKKQITILSGLTLDNARPKGDGGGDHARSAGAFLTGAHPYKTAGKDIKLGVSMDQVIARKVGDKTKLPSLELGLDRGQTAGNCDSGYSCAYVTNISWSSESTPMPKEVNPAAVFERMFGAGAGRESAESRTKRLLYRKSVLDLVADDAKQLDAQLGQSDQKKLDEFQTSIREIEKRIEKDQAEQATAKAPDVKLPDQVPHDFGEYMRLMSDMLVLAFQMDMTRVSSLMIARDGSDRIYHQLGGKEGHHTVSHHGKEESKIEMVKKIDHYHMEQFAYFLEKMASIKEGAGHAAGQQHDHAWQRHQRRRPPQPRRASDPARRPGWWADHARPPRALSRQHPPLQSLSNHDGKDGRESRSIRRQHRPPQGPPCLRRPTRLPVVSCVPRVADFPMAKRGCCADVTFTLSPGEVVGLLGPNGSGKSTLIRLLLGQLQGQGTIIWNNRPMAAWRGRELARFVAYLPQFPTYEPGQTVADILRLGRAPYWGAFGLESPRDLEVVGEVSRLLDLEDLLTAPPTSSPAASASASSSAAAWCKNPAPSSWTSQALPSTFATR